MIREMLVGMVGMVPEMAAESRTKMIALKKARVMDRMMISGLVSEMVVEVQGRSLARAVVKDLLEIIWWRGGLESTKLGL